MPVSPAYALLASQVLVVPTGIHDPLVDVPLLAPVLATGPSATIPPYSQKTGVAIEDAFRYGGGAYCIAAQAGNGLALSDGGGLTVNVDTGVALLDFPVVRKVVYPLALTNNVRNFIWLPSGGTPTKVATSLAAPTAACACLGAVDCAGGVITAIDYGPRYELGAGGVLRRRTADAGAPTDTPAATARFYSQSLDALYLWTGAAYQRAATTLPLLAESVPVSTTAYIPAGQQAQVFGPPFLRIRGHFRVRGWN
jgi:hypothetical protein